MAQHFYSLLSRLTLAALLLPGLVTAQTVLIDPAAEGGFENGTTFAANGWTVVNGTQANQWVLGTVAAVSGNGAYISNNGGATNNYNFNSASVTSFYRSVTFPAGETDITLAFQWRAEGEGDPPFQNWDYLRVYLAPSDFIPEAGVQVPDIYNISEDGWYNQQGAAFNQETIDVPLTAAGQTFNLIFEWKNDAIIGFQPPAAIDRVSLITQVEPPTFDVTVTELLSPEGELCDEAEVIVEFENTGNQPVDGITLTTELAGPTADTLSVSYAETDTLAILSFDTLNVGTFTGLLPGDYTLTTYVTFPANSDPTGDTLVSTFSIVVEDIPLLQDFESYTGSSATLGGGWFESDLANLPDDAFTSWASSNTTQEAFFGTSTAQVNMATFARDEWIVSPKFSPDAGTVVRFRAAVTNDNNADPPLNDGMATTDDSIRVLVSTDCAFTFTEVFAITGEDSLTNVFETFTVPLGAFAGQSIQIGFQATEGQVNNDPGTDDYEFHLDDVLIFSPQPIDLAATALLAPPGPNICGGVEPLTVLVTNFGTDAVSNYTVGVQISGAASGTVQTTVTETIAPDATATIEVGTFDFSAFGDYDLVAFVNATGDGTAANDSADAVTFTYEPPVALPIAQNFEGFAGTNTTLSGGWYETDEQAPAEPTTSLWGQSNDVQTTFFGSTTAKINLFTTSRDEWIVSPAFIPEDDTQISFEAAVTNWLGADPDNDNGMVGTDDSVSVLISTDCAQSWTLLSAITGADNLTNELVPFAIDLAPFAGQYVRIAFRATDGPTNDINDYDFHLDNILIDEKPAADAAVSELIPNTPSCGALTEDFSLVVSNGGLGPFSAAPVQLVIFGPLEDSPTSDTLSGTTGTVAISGADTVSLGNFTFVEGTYELTATVALTDDDNTANDTLTRTFEYVLPSELPLSQDFTGYDGDNETLSGGWYETDENNTAVPSTSLWTESSATQTTFFGSTTARLSLFTTSRDEWIVSPSFVPTATTEMTFDAAVTESFNAEPDGSGGMTGTDDSVSVLVSTDCAQTWTLLRAVTADDNLTNELVTFAVDLGTYAGQTIQVAFRATDGPIDDLPFYNFHLDNINIEEKPQVDVAVAEIIPAEIDCQSDSADLFVVVANAGVDTLTNLTVGLTVGGAGTGTFTATVAGPLLPSASDTVSFGTFFFTTGGDYTLEATVAVADDERPENDTLNRTLNYEPPVVLPLFQPFDGYTGIGETLSGGWYEANSPNPEVPSNSSWTVGSSTQQEVLGLTARINFSFSTDSEWIVSPPFVPNAQTELTFRAGLTDSFNPDPPEDEGMGGKDDSVRVMISTDCAITWTELDAIEATDSLTEVFRDFTVALSGFAGQEVRVAFWATEGEDDLGSYDFHLDDILIRERPPFDLAVREITPTELGCGSDSEEFFAVVENTGLNAISAFDVSLQVSGAATSSTTSNFTIDLAPDSTAIVSLGTFNFTVDGTYELAAIGSLTGDEQAFNDTARVIIDFLNPFIPPIAQNFDGYEGTEATLSGGWYEAQTEDLPNSGTSLWTDGTDAQFAAFGKTARVNLFVASRDEWLISPRFTVGDSTFLFFDAAVTNFANAGPDNDGGMDGTDDSVRVMISTDCGVTWDSLLVITAADSLTNVFETYDYNLGAFSGQDVQIGFWATDGPINDVNDYDFHLDGISLRDIFGKNAAGVFTRPLLTTANGCNLSESEPVQMVCRNDGVDTLTSIPASLAIVFENDTTIIDTVFTFDEDPLAFGEADTVTFQGAQGADLSAPGTYQLFTYTRLAGDAVEANDTTNVVTVNSFAIPDAPAVNLSDTAVCDSFEAFELVAAGVEGQTTRWYDSPDGMSPLAFGDTLGVPALTDSATYYVSTTDGSLFLAGASDPGASLSYFGAPSFGLNFTASQEFTLEGVFVYTQFADATVSVALQDDEGGEIGTPVTVTVAEPGVATFVPLFFDVTPGDYRLVSGNATPLARTQVADATFPYTVENVISITSQVPNVTTGDNYYFFYNWVISDGGCESERTPVTISVTPSPEAPTASDTIVCELEGGAVLDLTADVPMGATLNWYAGADDETPLFTGVTYTTDPLTETTTFFVGASLGDCESERTPLTVTVVALPDAPATVDTTVCDTTGVELELTVPSLPGVTLFWYPTPDEEVPLNVGETYTTGVLTETTTFFVSAAVGECESERTPLTVNIVAPPVADFTADAEGTSVTFTNNSANGSLYIWNFGEGATPATDTLTTTDPVSVIYDDAGTRTVQLVVVGDEGCENDTLEIELVITNLAGGLVESVGVFPNPNEGQFRIELTGVRAAEALVEVTNVQGQILHRHRATPQARQVSETVDLRQYPAGLYLLRVTVEGRTIVRKINVR